MHEKYLTSTREENSFPRTKKKERKLRVALEGAFIFIKDDHDDSGNNYCKGALPLYQGVKGCAE
jgi:hypothetical protein